MVITNGTVTYERTVRPADFESKKASVTLSFAFDPDESGDRGPAIENVGELARHYALNMLGVLESRPEPQKAAEPPKPRRAAAKPPAVEADPAAIPGSPITATEVAAAHEGKAVVEPDIDAIEAIAPAPAPAETAITDQALNSAVLKHRESSGASYNLKAVRDLIAEYAAPKVGMANIPQEKRAAFVSALKAIGNATA